MFSLRTYTGPRTQDLLQRIISGEASEDHHEDQLDATNDPVE